MSIDTAKMSRKLLSGPFLAELAELQDETLCQRDHLRLSTLLDDGLQYLDAEHQRAPLPLVVGRPLFVVVVYAPAGVVFNKPREDAILERAQRTVLVAISAARIGSRTAGCEGSLVLSDRREFFRDCSQWHVHKARGELFPHRRLPGKRLRGITMLHFWNRDCIHESLSGLIVLGAALVSGPSSLCLVAPTGRAQHAHCFGLRSDRRGRA
jgi:hypothetical protein